MTMAFVRGSVVFLGVIDGVFLSLIYVGTRFKPEKVSGWYVAVTVPSVFAGIAMQWVGLRQIALGNGLIGIVLGTMLIPRKSVADESSKDDISARPFEPEQD